MNRVISIILGCLITGIGTLLLAHAHLVIGGTAGLSLSLSYLMGIPFSPTFFVINIPFYTFAVLRMGWNFTLATFAAVTLLSCITGGLEHWLFNGFAVAPWIGATLGGGLAGLGLAILFENRSSLGGANILALYLEQKYNWNPGYTNCVFDSIVVLAGVYAAGLLRGLYSVLAVIVISSVIGYCKSRSAKRAQILSTATEL